METGRVAATVEQDGARSVHHVTRSAYVREGMFVDVTSSAFSVSLSAAHRTADAVLVPPPAATRGSWRTSSSATASFPAPVEDCAAGPRCCGFPCPVRVKYRTGCRSSSWWREPPHGRDPIRPLNHTDGTPLLRLDGSALSVGRPVELPLPTSLRPPCVLRGFLIGDGAAAVRLDEPSPTTLVVR